jgi:starch phosphorylase
MRLSMAELTPQFSTNRMVREYVEKLYLPAASACRERSADGAGKSIRLCRWRRMLETHWQQLSFGNLEFEERDGYYTFKLPIYNGDVDPEAIQVQLYAESRSGGQAETHPMVRDEEVSQPAQGCSYSARIPAQRPAGDYTPRIIPALEGAMVPIETNRILWYR